MKNSSNLNVSCKVVFSLNKWNKKVGSPSSFGRKRPFISLNSLASIENLSRSERARARARANHAINDAQKGCAMQLNGITLNPSVKSKHSCVFIRVRLNVCLHYYRQQFPFTLRIVSTKSLLFYFTSPQVFATLI